MIDLKRAKEICDAATQGLWAACGALVFSLDADRDRDRLISCDGGYGTSGGSNQGNDAEFIAFARGFVPEAVEEIEESRRLLELRTTGLNQYIDDCKRYILEIESLRKQLAEANAESKRLRTMDMAAEYTLGELDKLVKSLRKQLNESLSFITKAGEHAGKQLLEIEELRKRLQLAESVCEQVETKSYPVDISQWQAWRESQK